MTRAALIFIFLSAFCVSGLAQSKLSFSIDLAPNYSYRTYKAANYSEPTDRNPSGKEIFDSFNEFYANTEKPAFGLGLDLGIGYQLTDRVIINTGVGYLSIREKLLFTVPLSFYNYGGQTLVLYDSANSIQKEYNTYHYFSIPFDFQFRLFDWQKFSLGVIVGSEVNIKMGASITNLGYVSVTDPKYSSAKISKLVFNLNLGAICKYWLGEGVAVFMQPGFTRAITSNAEYNLSTADGVQCSIKQFNYSGRIKIGLIFLK